MPFVAFSNRAGPDQAAVKITSFDGNACLALAIENVYFTDSLSKCRFILLYHIDIINFSKSIIF